MSKKPAVEVQFDEFGNPVDVSQEAESDAWETFQQEAESDGMTSDHTNAYSLVNHSFIVASRNANQHYEVGVAGDAEFGFADILGICYRLEVPLSDDQIKAHVNKMLRTGVIGKGSKRGKYVAGRLMRLSTADLLAEFREIQARRNPTSR